MKKAPGKYYKYNIYTVGPPNNENIGTANYSLFRVFFIERYKYIKEFIIERFSQLGEFVIGGPTVNES